MSWVWWLLAYVIAGYLLECMCRWEAKRQGKTLKANLVILCYATGPLMVIWTCVTWPFKRKRK